MSRHGHALGASWESWGRDVGLGFSWKLGDLRADMAPGRNPETELIEWTAIVWRGDDRANVVVQLSGDTHWEVAELVNELAKNPPPVAGVAGRSASLDAWLADPGPRPGAIR